MTLKWKNKNWNMIIKFNNCRSLLGFQRIWLKKIMGIVKIIKKRQIRKFKKKLSLKSMHNANLIVIFKH